jgi:phosphate transport system substrate-binding protein
MDKMSQSILTKRTTIFIAITLILGLAIGYMVALQSTAAQTANLQNQINQLQANQPSGTIIVKGSDTLLIVAQQWAEEYMNQHTGVIISVGGGGSGVGLTALIDGTTDIADASREIKDSEIISAKANAVDPVEWIVGLDGISIVAHPTNPVTELTLEELEKIYNGTYTNWSQIGGNDAIIITYGRQSTSGTYEFFREFVLHKANYRSDNRELAGNAEIVQSVQSDVNGIGYVGVAYTKQGVNVKVLNIKTSPTVPAYEPTVENIASGAYPIARKLYIYTNGIPTGTLSDYISFILGPKGQQILEDVGYISYIKVAK